MLFKLVGKAFPDDWQSWLKNIAGSRRRPRQRGSRDDHRRRAESVGRRREGPSGVWPVPSSHAIWGTPGAGTHTLGNWQSDRAIDIGASATGLRCSPRQAGTASGIDINPDDGGRYGGSSVYVSGSDLRWYKHLKNIWVPEGKRVRAGDPIGAIGKNYHVHYAEYAGPVFGYAANLPAGFSAAMGRASPPAA